MAGLTDPRWEGLFHGDPRWEELLHLHGVSGWGGRCGGEMAVIPGGEPGYTFLLKKSAEDSLQSTASM